MNITTLNPQTPIAATDKPDQQQQEEARAEYEYLYAIYAGAEDYYPFIPRQAGQAASEALCGHARDL